MEALLAIDNYPRMAKAPRQSVTQISERLVELRRAIGGDGYGSQVKFCIQAGVTPNAWNNLEAGTNRISLDTALTVSQRTGASLDWIYKGEEYERYLPSDLLEKIRQVRERGPEPAVEKPLKARRAARSPRPPAA